jgi:hypothetical protein
MNRGLAPVRRDFPDNPARVVRFNGLIAGDWRGRTWFAAGSGEQKQRKEEKQLIHKIICATTTSNDVFTGCQPQYPDLQGDFNIDSKGLQEVSGTIRLNSPPTRLLKNSLKVSLKVFDRDFRW